MMALAGAKRACTRPDWLSVEEIDAACTEIDNVIRLLIDRERSSDQEILRALRSMTAIRRDYELMKKGDSDEDGL